MPPGLDIIERDHDGRVRMNPGVTLGDIAWKTLAELGSEEVRKIASDLPQRTGRSTTASDVVTPP